MLASNGASADQSCPSGKSGGQLFLQTSCKPEERERTVFKGTGWDVESRETLVRQDLWDQAVPVGMAPGELLIRGPQVRFLPGAPFQILDALGFR